MKIQKNNQQSAISNYVRRFNLGFTLLEMLVVIGIIAVLAGMGAVSYSTAQKKARDGKRKMDIGAIKNAMEQYYMLCNGSYPASDAGKVPETIETAVPPTCSPDPVIVIMSAAPHDPKNPAPSYDYDDSVTPPSICASDLAGGVANLMETETSTYCVYLEQ